MSSFVHAAVHVKDDLEKFKLIVAGMYNLMTYSFLISEGKAPIGVEFGETLNGETELGDKFFFEVVNTNPIRLLF